MPARFRWRDDAAVRADGAGAPEVTVMYQSGGYGALQVVPGTGTAVVVEMTGDNLGPPSAEEVVTTWALLRARLPGAELRAGSLDDVADLLRPVAADLPVVTAEIGDTWIHGIGTDPAKVAAFRELSRRRAGWIDRGLRRGRRPGAAAGVDGAAPGGRAHLGPGPEDALAGHGPLERVGPGRGAAGGRRPAGSSRAGPSSASTWTGWSRSWPGVDDRTWPTTHATRCEPPTRCRSTWTA